MMTVKQLAETCTADLKFIKLWTSDEGLYGVYQKLDWVPECEQDAIVRTWNIVDGSLCILI